MKLSKEIMQELVGVLYEAGKTTETWDDTYPVKFKLVYNDLIDTSRWSNIHEVVFEDLTTGKFWRSTYSVGATECQDERPYEYEGDEIELKQVFKKEKTITVYE